MDKRGKVGVILADLSKAFDTINHSFVLAKLDAYGFSRMPLKISINGSFSDWTEIVTGAPQVSILGPLLFNIFSNDVFMFISKCNLCIYADGNTLYSNGKDLNRIKRNLEIDFMILHIHYMVIGSSDQSHEIMLSNSKITSSNEKKQLGIFLDSKLNFQSHKGFLCRKASQEINALPSLKNFLTSDQRNLLLLGTVIKSQFTSCPLIWIFTSRYLNNALNNIHE